MSRKQAFAAGLAVPILLLASCTDETTSPLGSGDLQVALAMTGEVVDGDGATVLMDDWGSRAIFAGSAVEFTDLPAGNHVLELVDLAEHCTVVGQNPRSVRIDAGETTSSQFDVSCGTPSLMTVADMIVAAGLYPEEAPREDSTTTPEAEETRPDGSRWMCSTTTYSVVDAPVEYATFDPNAEVIYPASMLQGATLADATPEPVVVKRAGGTVVINLVNGSPGVAQHVDEVKQSTIIQAINDILANNDTVMPARFVYRSSSIQSEEELALELGVNVNTLGTKLKTQLEFSRDREYNRMMVEFVQTFYTVSFDLPRSLDELFHPSVTAGDLERYVGPGNPPTYISSVTYGRRFVLLIESTSSRMEMEAKVRASYDAAVANVKVENETDWVKNLEEVRIKVFALGGDQSLAAANFNGSDEALGNFLTQGGDMRTGVPLSYVVRNVLDNSVVNVKVATEYDVKDCRIVQDERFYSGFDGGVEGWVSVDNGTGTASLPQWKSADDCNSGFGGCILLTDHTSGNNRFQAPELWRDRADWSALYGGTLHYLARLNYAGYSPILSTPWVSDRWEVEIRGTAGNITANLPNSFRDGILNAWAPADLYLDENGTDFGNAKVYWRFNGHNATADEIRDVLEEVTGFLIRAEYISGTDYVWLDEVELVSPDDVAVGGGYPGG